MIYLSKEEIIIQCFSSVEVLLTRTEREREVEKLLWPKR